VTRTPLSSSKGQRSRSPGYFTHSHVCAAGSCSGGGMGNVLAVRNCCYVAVCSATRGASAPTGGGVGRDISWRPPAYSLFYRVYVFCPPALHNIFHTPVAWYSLFVLTVPLNTNQLTNHQNNEQVWILMELRMMEVATAARDSSQVVTTSIRTPSIFKKNWLHFLSPNQECRSTQGKKYHFTDLLNPSSTYGLPALSLTTKGS